MAADGIVRTGDLVASVAFPKIIRLRDGRIIGTTGCVVDCYAAQQWFLNGEPEARPSFYGLRSENNEVDILMLKPDGTIWRNGVGVDGFYPQPDPTTIGSYAACLVAKAAMACGQSAVDAVKLVGKLLAGFGGKVAFECVDPANIVSRAALPEGWPPGQETRGMSRERAWAEYRAKHPKEE